MLPVTAEHKAQLDDYVAKTWPRLKPLKIFSKTCAVNMAFRVEIPQRVLSCKRHSGASIR
jgi:hypothetical protein